MIHPFFSVTINIVRGGITMRKNTVSKLILASALLTGCTGTRNVQDVTYPAAISLDDMEAIEKNKTEHPIDQSVLDALKQFSINTSANLLTDEKNEVYSPISLYYALGMSGTGAQNETADEIWNAMGLSSLNAKQIADHMNNLYYNLYKDNEEGKIKIANSLWVAKDHEVKSDVKNTLADKYFASTHLVDFSDESANKEMNEWIKKETEGIIDPQIKNDPSTIISLINTIYFKSGWSSAFLEENTKSQTFHAPQGDITSDFMTQTIDVNPYEKKEGYTRTTLGMRDGSNMMLILPDEGVNMAEFMNSPSFQSALFDEYSDNKKVTIELPKFSFGSKYDLKSMLQKLNVKNAFNDQADFHAMSDSDLFISDIIQEASIDVNEIGIEAAAFTKVDFKEMALPMELEEVKLTFDRPFLYAILSDTKVPLFIGICSDPSTK